MTFIVFDTETTGIRKYSRLVQIAWQKFKNNKLIEKKDFIIKPKGFKIPTEASNIHGITTELAMQKGKDLKDVLQIFIKALEDVDYVVAHNIDYDYAIVSNEFVRMSLPNKLYKKKKICTMKASTNYLKIPKKRGRGYKWPNLTELHKALFGKEFKGAHNAQADVEATVKCFLELMNRKVIKLPT